MRRIKNTLRRIRTVSLSRMFRYAGLIRDESGKTRIRILFDMVYCYLRYGIGYLDYLTFGFVYQKRTRRRTFMTMNQNLTLVRKLNDPAFRDFFDDKLKFNQTFREYIGRDFADLRGMDAAAFSDFLKDKKIVFAKKTDEFGGKGIEQIVWEDGSDAKELRKCLLSNGMYDVEEAIRQHTEMNRLAGSSINSLRMVTLARDGEITLLYTLIRMSDGESFVDNISSGGMYCPVNEAGVITAGAFQDKTGLYFECHPKSGTVFRGFQIPFYEEAVTMVKKAAEIVPEIRYVGWDVAIGESGSLLIEGNIIPGYDMCQNYRHLGGDKTGILPRFKEILKDEI